MLAALLLLNPAQVNPRFYRAHFLVALGLGVAAALFVGRAAGPALWAALGAGLLGAFLGSAAWSLDGAPGGRLLIVLTLLPLAVALGLAEWAGGPAAADEGTAPVPLGWRLAGDLTAAALLGTSFTAMLLGHSYLTAPAMSLTPLLRLLAALGAATLARALVAGVGLWSWSADHSLGNLQDATVLWLPLRWGLGLAGPLVLGFMAWQAARIRSTQSATGILYVVVIFCFLGELTSQLLLGNTGFLL
jgi:hypothetical protein